MPPNGYVQSVVDTPEELPSELLGVSVRPYRELLFRHAVRVQYYNIGIVEYTVTTLEGSSSNRHEHDDGRPEEI